MMNLIEKIKRDLKSLPSDERQQSVQQYASWKAIISLIVSYMAIGSFYAIKNQSIPISTQLIFFVSFLTFAYLSIKQEGFSFLIPGMAETKKTLDQTTEARSIPWVMFFGGLVVLFLNLLSNPLKISWIWAILVQVILILPLSVTISWLIAKKVKYGNSFWVWFTYFGSMLGIYQYGFELLRSYHLLPVGVQYFTFVTASMPASQGASGSLAINFITSIWLFYALSRRRNELIKNGENFESNKYSEDKNGNLIPKVSIFQSLAVSLFLIIVGILLASFGSSVIVLLVSGTVFIVVGIYALIITLIKLFDKIKRKA